MVLICRNNGIQLYSCTCKQIISLPVHVNLRLRERLDCSTQAPPQMWSLPHFLFLLKPSNLVRFWWIFKYELLKDKKEKTKATKYRLAQQPKKKFCNKMNTLWDLLVPQNIYPEHLSIYISWEKKKSHSKGQRCNCLNLPGDMNVLPSDLSHRKPEYRSRINHNAYLMSEANWNSSTEHTGITVES